MTWDLDVDAVNKNATTIIKRLGREPLEVYKFIQKRYKSQNVKTDCLFQFVFRSYYRLDNAGLTDGFKTKFFELLESNRCCGEPDLQQLTENLFKIPNYRGQNALQFSFVTKLANTVNPSIPIYDSEVAKMYGFSAPLWYKGKDRRLEELLSFHRYMRKDYENMSKTEALSPALEALQRAYGEILDEIRTSRRIDFLLWSAGKLQQD